MADVTIELKDAKRWCDVAKADIHAAAVRGIMSAALRLQQEIVVRLIPAVSPQPVDRGIFRAGWKVSQDGDDAIIENTVPHAAFIEYGVRAANVKVGRAMIAALAEWAVRKRHVKKKDAVRVAFAIANAIKKRGIFAEGRGLHLLEIALKTRAEKYLKEEIKREINRIKPKA